MIPSAEQMPERKSSNGEKAFDFFTYGGLAGAGTFVITVPIADWITHGGGAKYYNAATEWITKKGVSPKIGAPLLMTTALMQGGNAMLLPIWAVEQVRTPIVQGINAITGDDTPIEEIAEKPQQTARTLIEGRLTAFAAVFAGLTAAGMMFGEQMQKFEHAMGRATAGFMNRPSHVNGKPTKTYRYGKTLAVDAFATAAAAGLLYTASRFFANKGAAKEEQEQQQTFANAEITAQNAPERTNNTEQATSGATNTPGVSVGAIDYDGRTTEQPLLGVSAV